MRKLVFSVTLLCGFTSFSQGLQPKNQQLASPQEVEKCSQHHHMQEMQLKDPARFATIFKDPLPNQGTKFKPNTGTEKLTGVIYTIPVVFHILHNNGSENISDAQVQDALNILNRDYRKLNADTSSIVAAFQGDAADVENAVLPSLNGASSNGGSEPNSTGRDQGCRTRFSRDCRTGRSR